ncbi:MAG: hypothetical protein GDA56_19200 [Hormoscilla sp. GM7CHS1pb]|nr:hypothetical protein [Hormoscilla sp. GM7CHS1pb]
MLPSVINENIVQLFKYWSEGIKEGMNHKGELYAQVRSYPSDARLQAYELGCEMAHSGMDICLTCSQSGYKVWMNLKSSVTASGIEAENRQPVLA